MASEDGVRVAVSCFHSLGQFLSPPILLQCYNVFHSIALYMSVTDITDLLVFKHIQLIIMFDGGLGTFDPAFCAHIWTELFFLKFCIIFHFFL